MLSSSGLSRRMGSLSSFPGFSSGLGKPSLCTLHPSCACSGLQGRILSVYLKRCGKGAPYVSAVKRLLSSGCKTLQYRSVTGEQASRSCISQLWKCLVSNVKERAYVRLQPVGHSGVLAELPRMERRSMSVGSRLHSLGGPQKSKTGRALSYQKFSILNELEKGQL